jgi:hypothetical protein
MYERDSGRTSDEVGQAFAGQSETEPVAEIDVVKDSKQDVVGHVFEACILRGGAFERDLRYVRRQLCVFVVIESHPLWYPEYLDVPGVVHFPPIGHPITIYDRSF